jgi:hypothetical protein
VVPNRRQMSGRSSYTWQPATPKWGQSQLDRAATCSASLICGRHATSSVDAKIGPQQSWHPGIHANSGICLRKKRIFSRLLIKFSCKYCGSIASGIPPCRQGPSCCGTTTRPRFRKNTRNWSTTFAAHFPASSTGEFARHCPLHHPIDPLKDRSMAQSRFLNFSFFPRNCIIHAGNTGRSPSLARPESPASGLS